MFYDYARWRKILLGGLLGLTGVALTASVTMAALKQKKNPPSRSSRVTLKQFSSCSALKQRLTQAQTESNRGYAERGGLMPIAVPSLPSLGTPSVKGMPAPTPLAAEDSAAGQALSTDYSRTNVQVEGADEADIVKMDGRYAYHLTQNRLAISQLKPVKEAKLLSITPVESGVYMQDLYADGDRVMLIGSKWEQRVYPVPTTQRRWFAPTVAISPWQGRNLTVIQVWDVQDRAKPKKLRTVSFDGALASSRLIDGKAYLIMNTWSPWQDNSSPSVVPSYRDSARSKAFLPMVSCAQVAYFDPRPTNQYLAIASVPLSGKGEVKRTVILGSAETVFASTQNMYVARTDWSLPPVRDTEDGSDEQDKTKIHKFVLTNGGIEYRAEQTVSGHLLNQFSLDEFEGNLRVATTKGQAWDSTKKSESQVHVLSSELKPLGKITGIAPGEQIYAMRFMGKRGYMVTFKKVDPFFVLDLADPKNPRVLGKLKIPGYSDYLHPLDENHIIGVGKNAVEAAEGDFAWYQGIKMAIFDVTDVANPREQWKTEIGDRGTDSPALHNHKAFFYAPSKQLLALPITLAELSSEVKSDPSRRGSEYGSFTFQGAYVYRLTLDKGFELLGRITHHENDDVFLKSGFYYGGYENDIERIHYLDNTLLTLAPGGLQLHKLYDLAKQGAVEYPKITQPVEGEYVK